MQLYWDPKPTAAHDWRDGGVFLRCRRASRLRQRGVRGRVRPGVPANEGQHAAAQLAAAPGLPWPALGEFRPCRRD